MAGGTGRVWWIPTIPMDFRGWTRPWTLGLDPSNQERRGVIPHPRPFPGPGSVPRAGFPSSAPAQGLGAGGNSSGSPRCQARSGACESGGWGAGASPFSSPLCAPPAAAAASSLPSPRRDTYRGRAAPRGRAGRRRRGPTSLGPWPRRERLVARGATVEATWLQNGLGHIQLQMVVAPRCLC